MFDKREMFKTSHPDYFKESPKTVDMFIRKPQEDSVKQFFLHDIDKLLDDYEPGLPKMKPDVLKQIKEIEANREKMIEEAKLANGPIVLQRPGQEPQHLTNIQVVKIIKDLQTNNATLTEKDTQNTRYIGLLQQKIAELNKTHNNTSDTNDIQQQLNEITAANQSLQTKLISNVR